MRSNFFVLVLIAAGSGVCGTGCTKQPPETAVAAPENETKKADRDTSSPQLGEAQKQIKENGPLRRNGDLVAANSATETGPPAPIGVPQNSAEQGTQASAQDATQHGHGSHGHSSESSGEKKKRSPEKPPPSSPKAAQDQVSMLFFHEPDHCPHCQYQVPQVRDFENRHRDVKVTWRSAGSLTPAEKALLSGKTVHPIMVFHAQGHKMIVTGRTSVSSLEAALGEFRGNVAAATKKGERVNAATGSNIVCR